MPTVFVDKTVMKTTEKDQIVQISGPSLGPVSNVMNLKPALVSTSAELAPPAVTMMSQAT